jgi:hypothetical protein
MQQHKQRQIIKQKSKSADLIPVPTVSNILKNQDRVKLIIIPEIEYHNKKL